MAREEDERKWDANISSDIRRVIKWLGLHYKNLVNLGQCNHGTDYESSDATLHAFWCSVTDWNTMFLSNAYQEDVGGENRHPSEQTENSAKVDKTLENLSRIIRHVYKRQKCD